MNHGDPSSCNSSFEESRIQVLATPLLRNREFEIHSSYFGGIYPTLIIREQSRLKRMNDDVTLNHLSVTVDTTLFPDTLKMKVLGEGGQKIWKFCGRHKWKPLKHQVIQGDTSGCSPTLDSGPVWLLQRP